jgi:sugar transferase (PEP-CTERM system associated)
VVSIFRHHFPLTTVLQLLAEAALFVFAVLLAVALTNDRQWVSPFSAMLPAVSFAAVMLLMNGAFGLYQQDRRFAPGALVARLLMSLTAGVAVTYLAFFVIPNGNIVQPAIGYAVLYAFVGAFCVHQIALSPRTSALLSHRVLVIGVGRDALAVERALETSGMSGMAVVGFVNPRSDQDQEVAVPSGRIVADVAAITDAVSRLAVDEVIVAVREQRGGVLPLRELLDCRLNGVRVTTLAGFFERVHGEVPIESLKASWLIYGEGFEQGRFRSLVKRVFDVMAALVLLVLALPVMALTALAIRFESRGPAIYRQHRVGRGGVPFTLLKFRSMVLHAEKDGEAKWAGADDSRVTGVGRFIRRARIDELPQLWNVLKGEMSFVGPRPERPCFVEQLKKTIPFYAVRHSVKPGLTGWAQVKYTYAASVEDSARKLQFDLYYVKNHSLFLDLLILVDTVRVVVFREGAR